MTPGQLDSASTHFLKRNTRVLRLPTPQSPAAWDSFTMIPGASCIPPAQGQQCNPIPGDTRDRLPSADPAPGMRDWPPSLSRLHPQRHPNPAPYNRTGPGHPGLAPWASRTGSPQSPGDQDQPPRPCPARAQLLTLSPPPAPPASAAHRTDFVLEGAQRRGCPGWGMDRRARPVPWPRPRPGAGGPVPPRTPARPRSYPAALQTFLPRGLSSWAASRLSTDSSSSSGSSAAPARARRGGRSPRAAISGGTPGPSRSRHSPARAGRCPPARCRSPPVPVPAGPRCRSAGGSRAAIASPPPPPRPSLRRREGLRRQPGNSALVPLTAGQAPGAAAAAAAPAPSSAAPTAPRGSTGWAAPLKSGRVPEREWEDAESWLPAQPGVPAAPGSPGSPVARGVDGPRTDSTGGRLSRRFGSRRAPGVSSSLTVSGVWVSRDPAAPGVRQPWVSQSSGF